MWAVARYDLGLTEQEFLDITPARFFALIDRHNSEKQEQDYRAGIIASNIVRVHASKEDSAKYGPGYFFPSLRSEREVAATKVRSTPEEMKRHLQTVYPPKKAQ